VNARPRSLELPGDEIDDSAGRATMITHAPGTDRTIDATTEIALPRPRTVEPQSAAGPTPAPVPVGTQDPSLVAAQLESSVALLTVVVRLALLIMVGAVVLVVAL
jgi:hypothetical protein